MFSPEASMQSARSSLRNPRRRPRNDSDGLQQQHRRKRSKLNADSFKEPSDAHVNGHGAALMNGHAVQSVENSVVLVDMPVREKKAAPKRAPKEDNGLYLTKNANYTVKKLPGFPSALLHPSTPIYATALPSAGLALALTSDRALVWDYSAANGPTKVVSLSLNFGLRASEPLPLGAIVRNGPTNDFGVVAVAPSTGKIGFWENIDSADTRSLYPQRQQGVEGFVKLYSGETITNLIDVEHAGYVLVFSSGRLAQLTLRDSQGRPNIATTILSAPNGSSGSFFNFKGLLGGSIRKTIASVKARTSQSKGHMEVISVTRNGLFQTWDLSWSGQHNHQRDVDVHDGILSAVQADTAPETRSQQDVHVLDFAIMDDQQQSQDTVSVLVLVALSGRESLDYFLLEVHLSSIVGTISRAIPIRNFHQSQLPKEAMGTLLLPQPGHTAYVQFPGAMFITSLAQPEESPEAQLLADSGHISLPFQDTVYFHSGVAVSGHAMELSSRKDRRATVLVFVQEFGLLQIDTLPPTTDDQEKDRLKVTARSKLEQATFFSTTTGNIIDFSIKSRFSFSEEETEQAALAISAGILSSSFEYLEKVTSSLDDQFRKRAYALRILISQLQTEYPTVSFQTKWRLLWHAEKLAATHKLWNWYQDKLLDQQGHPDAYPEKILMHDIVRALNERYKTAIDPQLGETDSIRQFFLKDVDSIQTLIPWGWFYLRAFYIKQSKETRSIMQRLSEGTDVMLVTLDTAFDFRKTNIESYGLEPDCLDDSILKPAHGYDMLPAFWTSSHNIVSSIRSLIDVGRNLAVENYEEGYQEILAQKIGQDNPRLVKLGCRTHIERFQWALAQSDEKTVAMGRSLKDEWNNNVRPAHIMGLMEIGLPTEGMTLAEQYHDMPTLVDLIREESNWLESEKANTRSKMEQAESTVKLNRIKERIRGYFETYGDTWAVAFYSKYIKENQADQLFTKDYLNQPALTKFLRAEPSRVRLAWINEVCGEKNYDAAAEALYEAGSQQETNSWCQRVEFSMAKLALLCKNEAKHGGNQQAVSDPGVDQTKAAKARQTMVRSIAQQLEYTKIQEEVYARLLPIITGALDDDSAVELLMAEYGQGRLRDRPAHQSILKEGFESLVHHKVIDPALMVDVLTLMNADDSEEGTTLLEGDEFIYAFRVLCVSWKNIHRTTRDGMLKLVWKRLCIKEDWAAINETKDVADAKIQDTLKHTAVVRALRSIVGSAAKDANARLLMPKGVQSLLGAGGTHGELCVRFAAEDLREPIIKDNLLDDDILREHITKHRLTEWFVQAFNVSKTMYYQGTGQQGKPQTAPGAPQITSNGGPPEMDAEMAQESAGSETFDGDEESGNEQDIEMQDS